jgi:hypothetical protein
MELFGAVVGLSLAAWILVAIVGALLLPALYLWMLIDAILRDESDYPSHDIAEKLVWIVLILVLQPVAALYFLLVWLPGRRNRTYGVGQARQESGSVAPSPTCC